LRLLPELRSMSGAAYGRICSNSQCRHHLQQRGQTYAKHSPEIDACNDAQ
jgi:hypothetical protein